MAAPQVNDIFVRLKTQGFEGIDKIKGSFRDLGKVTGLTDEEIRKLRVNILNLGTATDRTAQLLRGQTSVLTALQSQAKLNSGTYKELAKDIDSLNAAYKEAATGVKQFSDAQLRAQKVGAKGSTFGAQIAVLKKDLAELSVYSKDYESKLTAIKRRELPYNLAQGRQNVIAAEAAYRLGPELANAATKMPQLPNTSAGVSQGLAELRAELQNVELGGKRWREVIISIDKEERRLLKSQQDLNRELANTPIARTQARLEAARQNQTGFGTWSQGINDPVQKSIARNERRLERQAAARSGAMQGPAEASELFQGIAALQGQSAANNAQLMGRSYKQVAATLREVASTSDGSVRSLRSQREVWLSLRDGVRATSKEYRDANREINKLDAQIERSSGRRRLGAAGVTQAAGAAIAGGIYGGPEGFLGGVAGAALGGVEGAFAGAAIGAQVGMIRQQIGQMAEYAAQIRQTRTALQGIVSSFGDYQTAISTVTGASERFNVPVLEGAKQFTRLSAAVVGSGRSIQDAKLAYEAVTASILATTGSVEGVDAALTAVSQVFSKGKATAEEIRGQLGERLPGALALFAASLNKTPQELDKAFEEGKVSTDDFVKFLAYAYKRYAKDAEILAKSTEMAGERMARQWEKTAKAIGDAFGPTGAAIQDFATRALAQLNAVVEKLMQTGAIKPGAGYYVSQVEEGRLSLKDLRAMRNEASPQGFKEREATRARVRSDAFVGPRTAAEERQAAYTSKVSVKFDQAKFDTLNAAVSTLDAIRRRTDSKKQADLKTGTDSKAAEAAKEQEKRAKALLTAIDTRDKALFDARVQREEQLADIRLRAAEDAKRIELQFADTRLQIERNIAAIRQKASDRAEDTALAVRRAQGEDSALLDISRKFIEIGRTARDERLTLEQQIADDERTQARTLADYQKGVADAINKTNLAYARRVGEIQHDYAVRSAEAISKGTKDAAQRLAYAGELTVRRNQLLAEQEANRTYVRDIQTGQVTVSQEAADMEVKKQITRAKKLNARIQQLERLLAAAPTSLPTAPSAAVAPVRSAPMPTLAGAAAGVSSARQQQLAQTDASARTNLAEQSVLAFKESVAASTQGLADLEKGVKDFYETRKLTDLGVSEGLAKQLITLEDTYRLEIAKAARTKESADIEAKKLANQADANILLEDNIAGYENAVELAKSQYLNSTLLTVELAKQNDLLRLRQDTDVAGGFYEGTRKYVESIGTLKAATTDLTTNAIKGLEDQLVSLATTGSINFRELANSIIKDTIRMITQQFILRTIMAPLANLGNPISSMLGMLGGSGTSSLPAFSAGMPALAPSLQGIPFFGGTPMAKGGIFATNGIQPFAMGGVVRRPTMFAYANGGVPGAGLMGEAGPEAIMPLRRGADGKLGVAGGGGTTNITVNVSSDGTTSTQGNADTSAQLGKAVASAVQAELLRQKRPGGLLS